MRDMRISIYHNGKTLVVERHFLNTVTGRYTTQDLTQPRKGTGWESKVSQYFNGSDSFDHPPLFPWQEHQFLPLATEAPDLCHSCGAHKNSGNHVTPRTEPSAEDVAEWNAMRDKEQYVSIKSLTEVAREAQVIIDAHEEGRYIDAIIDAGEFSDVAHWRMVDKELDDLASKHGYTRDEIESELILAGYSYEVTT